MKATPPAVPLSLHQLSLYNTGRMTSAQIIEAFGVRRPLLQRLIEDIVAEKPKSRPQHHLIVGQRGMGKTMLLARIAAELRTRPELQARFIPLVFAEEQYAVDRLSKFWLNCLDSLADARELNTQTAEVDAIDSTVAALTRRTVPSVKNDQPYADEVYAAFIQAAQVHGQRPVLLVDNLQLVFERLENEQQHSLRELLMRPGAPILIGASPSPPPQSQDYGAAFYDHFKVHYLRPLDDTEMRDLLLHLAEKAGRNDVRQKVLSHPRRLKVLRQLTGGNPRTTLTLFFLYAEDFAPSVFGDLENLLDRVTPLYKARFEELTPQQQVITSAIANHWDPVTAATLAERTALPASTISAQIDRLEKTGTVERVELHGESRTGYMIAERFFNIWFLMRSASRRQRREVEFLVRFLENFYEPEERTGIARYLMKEERLSPDRYLFCCAVARSLPDHATAADLNRHSQLLALQETEAEARRRMRELLDFDSLPPATLAFHELKTKLMNLVPQGAPITPEDFAKAVLADPEMFGSGEREKLAARPGKLNEEELKSILDTVRKSQRLLLLTHAEEAVEWFSGRLANGLLSHIGNEEDWVRAFKQADTQDNLRIMAKALPIHPPAKLAIETKKMFREALKPSDNINAAQWAFWAELLHYKLGLHEESKPAYEKAIELDPSNASLWEDYGILLHIYLGEFKAAEKALRKAMNLAPSDPWIEGSLGHLLVNTSQFREAELLLRQAAAKQPENAHLWANLGKALNGIQQYPEAENAFRRAVDLSADNWGCWISMGNFYVSKACYQEALTAYNKSILLRPDILELRCVSLILQRDYMGEVTEALSLLNEVKKLAQPEDTERVHLEEMLFHAYDSNWGLTSDSLDKALKILLETTENDAPLGEPHYSAVLIHLNYGQELLSYLEQRGDTTARLRPWYEALKAVIAGDKKALQNLAPEVRTAAKVLFNSITSFLSRLPEKTRRRPLPSSSAKPRKRRQ